MRLRAVLTLSFCWGLVCTGHWQPGIDIHIMQAIVCQLTDGLVHGYPA